MPKSATTRQPMSASFVHMAELVMPNDTNPHGTLSGGRLMHWIDLAGAMSAMRHARRRVVTAAIDDVTFHAPIPEGHMVLLEAVVTCVGRTSMEVRVDVRGENPVIMKSPSRPKSPWVPALTWVKLGPARYGAATRGSKSRPRAPMSPPRMARPLRHREVQARSVSPHNFRPLAGKKTPAAARDSERWWTNAGESPQSAAKEPHRPDVRSRGGRAGGGMKGVRG